MRHIILSISFIFLLVSCNILSDSEFDTEFPGDQNVSWVEQRISGGQQCNTNDDFVPPETEELLNSRGIAVFETEILPLVTCSACGCPAYAAIHYALIRTDNLDAANQIGFELSDGPERLN